MFCFRKGRSTAKNRTLTMKVSNFKRQSILEMMNGSSTYFGRFIVWYFRCLKDQHCIPCLALESHLMMTCWGVKSVSIKRFSSQAWLTESAGAGAEFLRGAAKVSTLVLYLWPFERAAAGGTCGYSCGTRT